MKKIPPSHGLTLPVQTRITRVYIHVLNDDHTSSTGQYAVTDTDFSEEIPYSIEVGLLGIVRKVITLMPDARIKRVVGYVIQHEALIALAHNKSIVIRTAVVRVSAVQSTCTCTCMYSPFLVDLYTLIHVYTSTFW